MPILLSIHISPESLNRLRFYGKILGYLISPTAITALIFNKARHLWEQRRLKAEITMAEERCLSQTSLLTIAGSQMELTYSQLRLLISGAEFYVPVPNEYLETLVHYARDFAQQGGSTASLARELKSEAANLIPQVELLLSQAATTTARELIHRAQRGQRIFNGVTFHPMSVTTSADLQEHPTVDIRFYRTDFFTTRTLHNAFLAFQSLPATQLDFHNEDTRLKLRLLWNGFGLNCMVCIVKPKANSAKDGVLVLGKRSSRVSKGASTGKWHVTANEALSGQDEVDQELNVEHFVKRSLREEVGVTSDQVKSIYILSVGMVLTDYQPCVMALAICEAANLTEILYRTHGSQDGALEYEQHTFLSCDDAVIQKALDIGGIKDEHTGILTEFSPTADSVLRSILARHSRSFSVR